MCAEEREECGILPINKDGFEIGHYESFALVYIGDSKEWIHPKAEITEEETISGNYSLKWNADSEEQRWMFVSNAFYLRKPYKVSAKVRINADNGKAALLGAIESYGKQGESRQALVDALRISGSDVFLDINADANNWKDSANFKKTGVIKSNKIYTLSIAYTEENEVNAEVIDESNQEVVAKLNGQSKTENNGVGLFVHLNPAESGDIMYDDFQVESAPYQIKANKWIRSPRFVILPRLSDMIQAQGNWVGAGSAMYDEGIYKLWYRIRKADVRGVGYGYAESKDVLEWQKYKENPIIFLNEDKYSSCEKISVLKVDSQYKAWYTVNAPGEWHVIYATSDDGIHWTKYGEVLRDGNYKDPDVIYVEGTYYMYVIHPTGQELSVLTSKDGIDWTFQSKIPAPGHVHPAAYYVKDTGKFWLYQDIPELRRASSDDGISFDNFELVFSIPPVGLDDNQLESDGVNYPTFLRDVHGHLKSDNDILMIYQARHSYLNNRPSWRYAQDGKLVLAGRFNGLYLNVPTEIASDSTMTYSNFPIHCQRIHELEVTTDSVLKLIVNSWNTSDEKVGLWTVAAESAEVKYSVSNLTPGTEYKLLVEEEVKDTKTADEEGKVNFEVKVTAEQVCLLVKVNERK